MATLLRGKNKGKEVKIIQWCNDWIHIDGGEFYGIVTPTSLQYTHKEMLEILQHKNNGTLLDEFEPTFDMRFKRRKKNALHPGSSSTEAD